LSPAGQGAYPGLLREAARQYDDDWLAARLSAGGLLNATERRRKPRGGWSVVRVPHTAPLTLAEGEFNRYFLRGLCRLAQERGVVSLTVYRAKAVAQPRPESERLLGTPVNAERLLADLRANQGVDTAL